MPLTARLLSLPLAVLGCGVLHAQPSTVRAPAPTAEAAAAEMNSRRHEAASGPYRERAVPPSAHFVEPATAPIEQRGPAPDRITSDGLPIGQAAEAADLPQPLADQPQDARHLTGANARAQLPLAPRRSSATEPDKLTDEQGKARAMGLPVGSLPPLLTVCGSLALVLTLFFAVAWLMRRTLRGAARNLPSDVLEVLGHTALAGKQQMQLIRCGQKLLLVAVTTAGVETLTEITDPDEVDRLCGLCHQRHPASATTAFRKVIDEVSRESPVEDLFESTRAESLAAVGGSQVGGSRDSLWKESHDG